MEVGKVKRGRYKIQYGYTASASDSGSARLLRITDIQDGQVEWNSTPYCSPTASEIKKFELKTDDILIARTGGTIGKSFLVQNTPSEPSVFASYLIRISPETQLISPNFLKFFLESPYYWTQLKDNSRGTGQPNVNAKALGNLRLPFLPRRAAPYRREALRALQGPRPPHRLSNADSNPADKKRPAGHFVQTGGASSAGKEERHALPGRPPGLRSDCPIRPKEPEVFEKQSPDVASLQTQDFSTRLLGIHRRHGLGLRDHPPVSFFTSGGFKIDRSANPESSPRPRPSRRRREEHPTPPPPTAKRQPIIAESRSASTVKSAHGEDEHPPADRERQLPLAEVLHRQHRRDHHPPTTPRP